MTMTNSVPCPHCGDQNVSGGAFCQSCGKALPSAITQGPRVVGGKEFASTAAGQKLQSAELHKQAMWASRRFIWIGVILTIYGLMFLHAAMNLPPGRQPLIPYNHWVYLFVGVSFLGLGFWARFNPLPATIIGLGVYLAMTAYYVFVEYQVNQMQSIGPLLIIRGFIAIIILRAIGAGIRYRKLQEAQFSSIPMAGRVEQ